MRTMRTKLIGTAFVLAAVATPHASDPVCVYAKVDRVVIEPSAKAPETIQIWGVFAIARPDNGIDYEPAARGYLYYRVAAQPDLVRREWNDLEQIAGTGQIVAFGSRWSGRPRLRQASEKPENPDRYSTSVGVTKINGNTGYAPIRSLLDFSR